MIYLKIRIETIHPQKKMTFYKRIIKKMALLLLPVANPDFDSIIENATVWLLEFENEESIPVREIGIDLNGKVIIKMPYKRNYGYWSDNNITYLNFIEVFNYETILKEEFNSKWEELEL